jgi:F0F1-type ATP synthase delta subunit
MKKVSLDSAEEIDSPLLKKMLKLMVKNRNPLSNLHIEFNFPLTIEQQSELKAKFEKLKKTVSDEKG